ncbi:MULTISPECIES: hypothetical protein [Anoxybacillus]|uniref:Uncharacterized protein n=1 Tax=Anoxybacillus flavithermus TaxID=33934 RepID=A0AAX2A2W1_9BACL|nr:hypothetical protein [Anoxybacillus flavithermus]ELK21774.1 hypothetical protein AF6_1617 [Anoxybacillus flavithermus TNO-09.006]MBE2905603.1 hypothetical protein [Anoxybacillus flavithermus]MBE2914224.1 hypothetical protein [Anoxybacillus flavithermus]MBE2919897.1 hypothetical protein [Anoxybacillus flavithermus]MBE2922672.1 hypothetical protein [Anoxybacillus flavithermus]
MGNFLNFFVPISIVVTSAFGLIYVIRRERDYCPKCGGKLQDFYVDRNQRAFTDGELEAFKILHPEDRSTFQKVKYCRQCRKAYRHIT